jgi:hypothetical protein
MLAGNEQISITEHVGQSASSKTESNASTHPMHNQEEVKSDKVEIRHHQAYPGPVIPKGTYSSLNNLSRKLLTYLDMPGEEGTKAERMAKVQEKNCKLPLLPKKPRY